MLSSELEYCLNQAFHQARSARHEFLTVEHLLLAIIDAPKVREVLRGLRRRPRAARRPTSSTTSRPTRRGSRPARSARCSRRWASSACCSERCFTCSRAARKRSAVVNVLVAIFSEKQSHAVFLLARAQVTRLDVVNYISHGLTRTGESKVDKDRDDSGVEGERDTESRQRARAATRST